MPRRSSQKPYSILFTVSSLNRGGAELRLLDVVRHLDSGLFTPIVFAAKGGGLTGELPHGQIIFGMQGKNVLFSLPRFVRTLMTLRPTVLWCVSPGILSFAGRLMARLIGIPVVVLSLHGRDSVGPAMDRFNRSITGFTTDCVVTVSHYHKDEITADGVPADKIRVIHNGVDELRFQPSNHDVKTAVKSRLMNIRPHQAVVGTVGNLRPVKAQEVLVAAAAIVARKHSDAVFVIAGEGRLRSALEQQIQRLGLEGQVLLLGSRTDVPELLQAFDIFVLTSDLESCPNTILEAMATGLPVIATKVGGVPELVTEDTGILVPPQNPEALAVAIDELLGDSRRQDAMGSKALARATEFFPAERMVRERERLLLDLIQTKGLSQS